VGVAVREATLEALRWQNGLERSVTRDLFHALGRHGIHEQTVFAGLAQQLASSELELLRRNRKSAVYQPLVGACGHALATGLDRVRHGSLPESCARDALVQQAAMLAANLAAKPDQWPRFRARLHATQGPPAELVIAAIALGWSEKWRQD